VNQESASRKNEKQTLQISIYQMTCYPERCFQTAGKNQAQ
jgi:hypothetical protein